MGGRRRRKPTRATRKDKARAGESCSPRQQCTSHQTRDARSRMGKDVKVMEHWVYKPTPNGSNPALVFVSSCFSDTTCTGDGVGPTRALFTSLLGN